MKLLIYQASRSMNQYGLSKTRYWKIRPCDPATCEVNPLTEWVSSRDTHIQVQLRFESLEGAVQYVKSIGADYEIMPPEKTTLLPKSYQDNFLQSPRL